MATPQEKFANALTELKNIQEQGIIAIEAMDFPNRSIREILLKNGFIKEVSKGWYISKDPGETPGDTTSWFSSYWEFCSTFLKSKYDKSWCLSADQSLQIHAGNWGIPTQLYVRSPHGNNNLTPLPHNTSMFNYKYELPKEEFLVIERGLRIYNLENSLIYSTEGIFRDRPMDARVVLNMIRDASQLLPILIDNGHSTISGRLAGAFRNVGKEKIANEIIDTMKQIGYDVREEDPFTEKLMLRFDPRERSPSVNRIRIMWHEMRETVIKIFPKAPGIPSDISSYLKNVDEVYVTDAYHSLSIERYQVTTELIEKVSSGKWDKENDEGRRQKDAMAARGYFQTFQLVKESVTEILKGKNAGKTVDNDHQKWYRQLFDPSVQVGILKTSDLAGYRNNLVYIGSSKHVPLNVDALRDAMPTLFELLEQEEEASVRAVLGHFIFVFIHPYVDGNGRIGRFLMNAMLASGGYPWTVIPVEKRSEYMAALEIASVNYDIGSFANFLAKLVKSGLDGHPTAKLPA